MSVQYQIDYEDDDPRQSQPSENLPVQSRPRYVEVIDEKQSRFQIPSILKTASVFVLGALALASAEKYAPDTWRPSTIIGTYDARITSAVKAAELNQQARFEAWAAQVKVASDQNAEAYRAAMNASVANYQAGYDRAKIYAEAATRMQGQYAQMRIRSMHKRVPRMALSIWSRCSDTEPTHLKLAPVIKLLLTPKRCRAMFPIA